MDKAAILSPYFDSFGGGEKYLFSIAECISEKFEVHIFNSDISREVKEKFGISSDQFIYEGKNGGFNFISRFFRYSKYKIFFYSTDGSIFFPPAGKNFLIVQSPSHLPAVSPANSLKLGRWKILCYSNFMSDIIFERLGIRPFVLAPAIDTETFRPVGQKKKMILTVGRFFLFPHNKKQKELAEIYIKNYKKYFSGYEFVIAGGVNEKEGYGIIKEIKRISEGYPVKVVPNPSLTELALLYSQSSIYWHAAGYLEDETANPERVEHFGMTTLEAMASGSVPVVINKGGQKELVTEGKNGFLFSTERELVEKTRKIIDDPELAGRLSADSIKRAGDFSYSKFSRRLDEIISK